MEQPNRDTRRKVSFRESDSYDEGYGTNGSFTGRGSGINCFGEERIKYDHFENEEFSNDFDPTYEDEYGVRHPEETKRENLFGKGPKGYKRSPERIKDDACEILARDFELDASGISVELDDRVLILKGEVASRRDKRRAEWLLDELPGIEDIRNLLTIKKTNVEGWIPGLGSIEDEV